MSTFYTLHENLEKAFWHTLTRKLGKSLQHLGLGDAPCATGSGIRATGSESVI